MMLGCGGASADASVGALDAYTTNMTACYSASRRLLSAWGGALVDQTGGVVDKLWDQSNNGRHFSSTLTTRPGLSTAGPQSRACLDFDGSNDLMDTTGTSAPADLIAVNLGFIVMSVLIDTVNSTGANIFQNTALIAASNQNMGLFLKSNTGLIYAYNNDGAADTESAAYTTGSVKTYSWRHESSKVFLGIDGTEGAGTTSNNTSSLSASVMRLGYNGGGVNTFDGKFFEMAIWNSPPSAPDKAAIVTAMLNWLN